MPRSSSVAAAIAVSVIAPMVAVSKPGRNPLNEPGQSTSQVALVVSTMPPDSSVIGSDNNKK